VQFCAIKTANIKTLNPFILISNFISSQTSISRRVVDVQSKPISGANSCIDGTLL
jgi:hypothetical protein